MKRWKKYGAAILCLWCCLLILIGISQLTFGAYYISKLPVFKLGSPVWIGFLNILCATGLFGLHYKKLGLQQYWCQSNTERASENGQRQRNCSTTSPLQCSGTRQGKLYLSLCLSLTIVFINIANAILCEVGEWQHWMTIQEREQLRTGLLHQLALQAHRVTSAQMSAAIIVGILCSSCNVWMLYKRQLDIVRSSKAESQINEPIRSASGKKDNEGSHMSFDNPNWVYGDDTDVIELRPEPIIKGSLLKLGRHSPGTKSGQYVKPSVSIISDGDTTRHATIRRAPSIIHSLPDNFSFMREQLRSASLRGEKKAKQSNGVAVQRSKTMRETTFSTSNRFAAEAGFAKRFQPDQESPTVLSFIHDSTEKELKASQDLKANSVIANNTAETSVQTSNVSEESQPITQSNVRSTDKIILRVESFRALPIPTQVDGKQGIHPAAGIRPLRNIKRVSSSTQTELSILKGNTQRSDGAGRMRKSPSGMVTPPPVHLKMGYRSDKILNSDLQISPVESSSGYSSPRGTESKSPTPEPFAGTVPKGTEETYCPDDDESKSNCNVTVIQIDPNPNKGNHVVTSLKGDATYAVPRKRLEHHETTIHAATVEKKPMEQAFRVRIHSKPVNRSVSFHNLSHTARKSVYNDLDSSSPVQQPQMVPIPRPVLRSHSRYTPTSAATYSRKYGHPSDRHLYDVMTRSGSTLSRSSSLHLAMSEIQRKLDLLQLYANIPAHNVTDVAPVHGADYNNLDHYTTDYHHPRRSTYTANSNIYENNPRRKSKYKSSPSISPDLNDSLDSAETLAYLSELELLARHWRTQLMYKVELKATGKKSNHQIERDSFQC